MGALAAALRIDHVGDGCGRGAEPGASLSAKAKRPPAAYESQVPGLSLDLLSM